MTRAIPQVSLGSSRLVRFLADMSVSKQQMNHRQFTERLGQWIDFSDSISLSDAHVRELAIEHEDVASFSTGITEEFLRARSRIVQAAMRSFFPGKGPSRIRWPSTEPATADVDPEVAIKPYLKFYLLQQADIDSKVRGLHLRTREAVSALSARLARICAIDAALGDALAIQSRRQLMTVPALLEKRFALLYQNYLDTIEQGTDSRPAWQQTCEQFRRESQGLLLAEIEARLLPALGLVEALNEETTYEDHAVI